MKKSIFTAVLLCATASAFYAGSYMEHSKSERLIERLIDSNEYYKKKLQLPGYNRDLEIAKDVITLQSYALEEAETQICELTGDNEDACRFLEIQGIQPIGYYIDSLRKEMHFEYSLNREILNKVR